VSVKDGGHQEIRVRGNLQQILEKYLTLAREAMASGDRIAAENYYQHAEHYYRVLNANGGPNGGHGGANGGGANGGERRAQIEGGARPAAGEPEQAFADLAVAPAAANGFVSAEADGEQEPNTAVENHQ